MTLLLLLSLYWSVCVNHMVMSYYLQVYFGPSVTAIDTTKFSCQQHGSKDGIISLYVCTFLVWSFVQSTTLVHTEISQQLLDELL